MTRVENRNYCEKGALPGGAQLDLAEADRPAALHRDQADHLLALNEHASLAVTDRNGVITQVNDRFCEISQYSRDELHGNSHRLIKSGMHEPAFYERLWTTITQGQTWQGEICNRARDDSRYWALTTIVPFLDAAGAISKYIAIGADITHLKVLALEAQHLATHDPLTGLPNRRLFEDRLNQAMVSSERSGNHSALLCLDLDDFKHINDTFGHSVGDMLLCQVADRLTNCLRRNDCVARVGGDEFLLILQDIGHDLCTATSNARDLIGKIQRALNIPHILTQAAQTRACECISRFSVGIVLFQGSRVSGDKIVQQADIAMYRAKEMGRGQAAFFDIA